MKQKSNRVDIALMALAATEMTRFSHATRRIPGTDLVIVDEHPAIGIDVAGPTKYDLQAIEKAIAKRNRKAALRRKD